MSGRAFSVVLRSDGSPAQLTVCLFKPCHYGQTRSPWKLSLSVWPPRVPYGLEEADCSFGTLLFVFQHLLLAQYSNCLTGAPSITRRQTPQPASSEQTIIMQRFSFCLTRIGSMSTFTLISSPESRLNTWNRVLKPWSEAASERFTPCLLTTEPRLILNESRS